MESWNQLNHSQPLAEVFDMRNNGSPSMNTMVNHQSVQYDPTQETLQQLKVGFVKMMSTLERLEQRISRVEQTTSQILKTQQETLQVPFMSQTEVNQARRVAEQMEQDTNVAKQLQAAFNKEVEVKKNVTRTTSYNHTPMQLSECPICGVRVNQVDLEVHVDACLEMFSNDPKKEVEVRDTKKKVESGFFQKLGILKKTKTETTTTKVISNHPSSATAPLLSDHEGLMQHNPNFYSGGFAYPPFPHNSAINGQGNSNMPPMMMPMYMYPTYPSTHMTTHLQE